MAKSREEVEAMLAIEEAIAAGAGAGVSNASEMNRDTTGQQIQVLQRIAEQIRTGTLPPGSLTGVPSDNINADVAKFDEIMMGLPPEVINAVLAPKMRAVGSGSTSDQELQAFQRAISAPPAGGIQPENFGVLGGMGGATTGRPVQNMGASPGSPGATAGNIGMPPTASEADLLEEYAAGVRARGSQRR
jgi:hypothetical protein